ncbi:hypothetical protein KKE18_01905, partial [Patescibacteria group bacterium]|nr:hypothetical protein [Patescibacteria group bacterium]
MLKKVSQRFSQDKSIILLLLISIVLIGIRFLWLDRFPVGINHDEAEVVLSAKTYWKYGTDISLTPFPKSIFTNETSGGLSGLPSFLLTPFIGWAELTLQVARLPFVVLNIASLGLLALIVWQLTKNIVLTFSTIFVGLINPWLFAYSRATTEAPFALFFILLGIYLLFKYQGKKVLYSIIPFILAFYSYFGAKPAVLALVPLLLFLHWRFFGKTNKKI